LRNDKEVEIGPSPRASIALFKLSKFVALENDRDYTMPSDVLKFLKPVIRHRIKLDIDSESEEDEIIDKIAKMVAKGK